MKTIQKKAKLMAKADIFSFDDDDRIKKSPYAL